MDEFDIFLDAVARKIALDTLVERSLALGHRQSIFLTPGLEHCRSRRVRDQGLDEEVRRLQLGVEEVHHVVRHRKDVLKEE